MNRGFLLVAFVVALFATACGEDQEPARARELWDRINASGYTTWGRPQRFPVRETSTTLHLDAVDIFTNPQLGDAERGLPIATWPDGSMIVKDGYSGGDKGIVAVMEKTAGVWFFAEYDGKGKVLFSGRPKICVDCHGARESYSDWLYSMELPR